MLASQRYDVLSGQSDGPNGYTKAGYNVSILLIKMDTLYPILLRQGGTGNFYSSFQYIEWNLSLAHELL